jgi:hypothetical protein
MFVSHALWIILCSYVCHRTEPVLIKVTKNFLISTIKYLHLFIVLLEHYLFTGHYSSLCSSWVLFSFFVQKSSQVLPFLIRSLGSVASTCVLFSLYFVQLGYNKKRVFWIFYLCFILLFWVGGHCGIYKVSYNVSNISYLNSPTLHHSPLSLPPPICEIVPTDTFFPFIYLNTQYLHYIHPITPFPHLFPPALQFCKRKRKEIILLLV